MAIVGSNNITSLFGTPSNDTYMDLLTNKLIDLGGNKNAQVNQLPQSNDLISQLNTLNAQQAELLKKKQASLAAMTEASLAKPKTSFLRDDQTFLGALKDPGEAQRNFMIMAGLGLAASDPTKNLSQRIALALGSGVQALQKTRKEELERTLAKEKAQYARLELEGEKLKTDRESIKDIATIQNQIEDNKTNTQRLQEYRDSLMQRLSTIVDQDSNEAKDLKQKIFELDGDLAPRAQVNPVTGLLEKPLINQRNYTKGLPTFEETYDIGNELGSVLANSEYTRSIIYNADAFNKSYGGREYVTPGLAEATDWITRMTDPQATGYFEARKNLGVQRSLQDMRILAPVTETDTALLIELRGYDKSLSPMAVIKKFEEVTLPGEAQFIYNKNISYTGPNPQYGPELASTNMLIFAEANTRGALINDIPGISLRDISREQGKKEAFKRIDTLLRMYPTKLQANDLKGQGYYEFGNTGKIVSKEFFKTLAESYGVPVQQILSQSKSRVW